jgi:hypothetical protein
MAIGTNDTLPKFGTQDQVDDGSTSTIANNAYSVAADISEWTNTEDAPFANFILECQFDTTMPTAGAIDLFARVKDIQGGNEPGVPSDSHRKIWLGTFAIDFLVSADTNFFTTIEHAKLPLFYTSQKIDFYLKNNGTGQTMGQDWNLWINPYTYGPSA